MGIGTTSNLLPLRSLIGLHCHTPPNLFKPLELGVRIRGTLGDIDPLNKVPFKRAISKVKKGPL